MMDRGLDMGLVGNCAYGALLERGAVRWLCWPRPDSSFVFGSLLDGERGGAFAVEMPDAIEVVQEYVEDTNVLRTTFRGTSGAFELLDFAPRFAQFHRSFKPLMLVRILRPLTGEPWVRVRCRPVYDYGRVAAGSWAGSNHVEFTGLPAPVRLTTNLSLTHVGGERSFLLSKPRHLVLTWGEPLQAPLEETAESFLQRTVEHWRGWVKRARVPREWQRPVIRSMLALKLHQYEDTGALIAATTTSIPEHPGSGRCWDYRYCWLRDAYFTLNALERMGHLEEMEQFLLFLRDRCHERDGVLQPVYGVDGRRELDEVVLEDLAGFRGDGPVRIGNQAWQHVQNDAYGEMILGVSRMLLDVRFSDVEGVGGGLRLVGLLLDQIEQRLEEPDAGLWELRGSRQLHSFTLLMHWAGAMRAAEIGETLGDRELFERGTRLQKAARALLETRCWNEERGVLTQAAGSDGLDAAMLVALHLGFFPPGDPRASRHLEVLRQGLATDGGLLRRYDTQDDFGRTRAAFLVCSFWLVEALAIDGRGQEARTLFERLLQLHNGLGLYAEDVLPESLQLSGNFPQTYSHVGLINAAFRLSRPWS